MLWWVKIVLDSCIRVVERNTPGCFFYKLGPLPDSKSASPVPDGFLVAVLPTNETCHNIGA